MAEDLYTEDRDQSDSISGGSGIVEDSAGRYSGAFFPSAQHFVVAGGNFTSNVINPPPTVPDNFRRIPLGDVDLRHEIQLEKWSVVRRQHGGAPFWRIYSAHIEGRRSDMTVAVYQGPNAEENWKSEIQKYSGIRHPNFLQLYGAVSSSGLYAMIFHDELVPYADYTEEHPLSPMLTVYHLGCISSQDADDYNRFLHGHPMVHRDSLRLDECVKICHPDVTWIRRSTGRLCVGLDSSNRQSYWDLGKLPMDRPLPQISSLGPNRESAVVSSLSYGRYYSICDAYLAGKICFTIRLGAIVLWAGEKEIAWIPTLMFKNPGWQHEHAEIMNNGWTRIDSSAAHNSNISLTLTSRYEIGCWLSQANYVFSQASITENHEDYCLVDTVEYSVTLEFLPLDKIIPEGYLFLCPLANLQSEHGTFVQPTKSHTYWSLDPDGSERLSPEEASAHGFPSVNLNWGIFYKSLDEFAYTGLDEFHTGKGFNPNSQDIARHLGYPLYELCDRRLDGVLIEEVDSEPGKFL
ncbi:hypothetical protein B0H14DRAFT_3012889 [Mycena olivaceomarginata]|nr:hypothetical protein B0H14DRAFT_3012889 [Mycena olivaceomarginata]